MLACQQQSYQTGLVHTFVWGCALSFSRVSFANYWAIRWEGMSFFTIMLPYSIPFLIQLHFQPHSQGLSLLPPEWVGERETLGMRLQPLPIHLPGQEIQINYIINIYAVIFNILILGSARDFR